MTPRIRLAAILVALAAIPLVTPHPSVALPSRRSVQEQLDRISEQISEVDEQYNQARLDLEKVSSQIRDAERRKTEADEKLTTLKARALAHGVAVYRVGRPKFLEVLLTSNDIGEFQRRVSMVSRVAGWEAEVIDSLQIAQTRAARVREDLQGSLDKRRRIERSLASKRSYLEKRLEEQKALLAKIDAGSRRPAVAPPSVDFRTLGVSERAKVAVQTAYEQLGKPYRYAASGPNSFDCSGLTMFAWGRAGVSLPHSSRAQYSATPRVGRSQLQPGDLVFFYSPIHHVGIYIGGGRMIHAVSDGHPVRIDDVDYAGHYVGAGRPGV